MEIQVVELLGMENGIEKKKISLMNPKTYNVIISLMNPKTYNVMAKAHSYYTKKQKKEAKLNYKNSK
jgi:hypothetical protein